MTHFLIRGAMLGVVGGGLVACASTPAYPITSNPPAPAPAPPPVAVAPAPPPPATDSIPHPPPAPVVSQSLAPIETAQATGSETEPAPAPISDQGANPDQPAPTPTHILRRPWRESTRYAEPARYIAAGRVIQPHNMYRDYRVQRGDHLDAVARDLDTTRSTLIEANHLRNPDDLYPGQHLKVPVEKAYVAQSGDTLAAVAKRFDVSAAELADLNAMSSRERLYSGEQLALPSGFHDGGPVLVASIRPPTRYIPSAAYQPSPSTGYTPSPWAASAAQNRGESAAQPPPSYAYRPIEAEPVPTLTDAQVAEVGRGRFIWPVKGEVISAFGVKDVGRRNDGVDVRAAQGTAVRAAAAGDVVYAGDQVPGFGNLVLLKHADGWVTAYAHLDKVNVKMRDMVSQGDEIGEVGQSGGVSEPQLHFEIRYAPTPTEKAKPIDPLLVLPR